jgi:ribosome biogenesis GTPase A
MIWGACLLTLTEAFKFQRFMHFESKFSRNVIYSKRFDECQLKQFELDEIGQLLRKRNDDEDNDKQISLPAYMERMINGFEASKEKTLALRASKLPTIAVIGRPNTGKSTLVNKLTNSYRVESLFVFDSSF